MLASDSIVDAGEGRAEDAMEKGGEAVPSALGAIRRLSDWRHALVSLAVVMDDCQ